MTWSSTRVEDLSAAFVAAPFTVADAAEVGVSAQLLAQLCRERRLHRLLRGVYVDATVAVTLQVRVAALRLVVPPGAVVTDRTAAWLHGATMMLEPGAHLEVPQVSAFHRGRGCRLRNDMTRSGQRMMPDADIVEIDGISVTSLVRTALDLGRLLPRSQAMAGLDQMLRLGADHAEILGEVERFRTRRGVRQLRSLTPLADGRAESPGESALRLLWWDVSPPLPRPEPQVVVLGPWGEELRLDIGDAGSGFAAEYDGEEWHGPEHEEHDENRRRWLQSQGWHVEVFRRVHVFGQRRNADVRLRRAWNEWRRTR